MRSTKEWIGKTDDAKAPDYVRLRVFLKHDGRCHITGRKIRPGDKWELEHIVAICNGGENRESNLAPALVAAHKGKTRQDRAEKQRADSIRRRHIGIKPQSKFRGWRKMNGQVVWAKDRPWGHS
jgi:5-methylcytosine-specific restriction protein A